MDFMTHVETVHRKKDVPDFSPGDTVQVHLRIREGEKERVQVFEGVVIGRRGQCFALHAWSLNASRRWGQSREARGGGVFTAAVWA